ncbi:MAG TPA: M48 family metallopeptidase, partial [Candidatus Ozemobacteraceae bacterium]|nr:M48 family metallopeptidase [Candidatus Ozemobacteraceae bacterium]
LKSVKNDDELAAVMAHELAHINKKHGIRQAEKAGLLTAIVLAMGLKDETQKYQKYAAVAAFFANMKFSRNDEFEADKIAVQYASKAGYNPYGMSGFLQTINKDNALTKVTKYFSTHPPTTERITRANAEAQKVSGRAPPANTTAQGTQTSPVTTGSSSGSGSSSTGNSGTRPTTQPTTVPQGITLQEAYQDYLYTKSIYEQKVSQGAPYNEIMAAFNDYQRAKEIYFQLKNQAAQR